jgi:hypothetical protein
MDKAVSLPFHIGSNHPTWKTQAKVEVFSREKHSSLLRQNVILISKKVLEHWPRH